MKKIKQFAEDECLPFPTIADILTGIIDNKKCLLMTPINNFFNQTNIVVQPLKEVVKRTKSQVITDIGDSFFVEEATRQIRVMDQLNFQYFGFVLFFPRLLQLFIFIFGMLTMSCPLW